MADDDDRPAAADDNLAVLGALAEPSRRALYEFVVGSGDWVSRDQAAAGADVQRATAAHHLDRLAADGLLEVDYRRLSGRTGPGAGRPAKVYRRARRDFGVALPPRDYELAGRLLADAVDDAARTGRDVRQALERAARAAGRDIGAVMRDRLGRRTSGRAARAAAMAVLREHGFEPDDTDSGTVVLRNCPFHRLAQTHTELICGMNHCLIDAAIDELGAGGLDARFQPDPDTCCVRLTHARSQPG